MKKVKERVLVYGSGARDHCLCEEYAESSHVEKVFFVPGNPGVNYTHKGKKGIIKQIPIKDFDEIAKFCKENDVNLVDVGSENPLEEGLVDVLTDAGIPCIGPKKEYVRLENDREFTDKLLSKIGKEKFGYEYEIKPEWKSFTNPEEAKKYVKKIGYQVVVKANGLAKGKGAIVCNDVDDAIEAIDTIMIEKKFGKSGNKVIIEERKYGKEISFFAYLDGKHVLPLRMFAQDYKPAFDPENILEIFYHHYGRETSGKKFSGIRRGLQETGIRCPGNLEQMTEDERDEFLISKLKEKNIRLINSNTGGTGCYCPHKEAAPHLINTIIRKIVNPVVEEIYYELGWKYKGVLYFGLNRDPDGNLSVFEINVRHGDPEAEVILRKLQVDFYELGTAVTEGTLDSFKPKWNPNYYVDVIAMVGKGKDKKGAWYPGYPERYGKGYKIAGIEEVDEKGVTIFYSGVDIDAEKGLVTRGGRVLHIVASSSNSLSEAVEKAYRNIEKIKFIDHNNNNENCMRYRRTIGRD